MKKTRASQPPTGTAQTARNTAHSFESALISRHGGKRQAASGAALQGANLELVPSHTTADRVIRSSRRRAEQVDFAARYAPAGSVFEPERDTIDYFLTERYCLYTQDSTSNAYRVEIHHAPWQLQSAEMELSVNTMVDAAGLRLPSVAPLLHYARRQDVLTWSPHLLD